MGTDIHPCVEVKINGKWQPRSRCTLCCDREYETFAKLAGVRNGKGFGGVDMFEPLKPIAEGRGLPADTSIFDHDGDCWLGDHDVTWVTLAELLSIDLAEPVKMTGLIDKKAAEEFYQTGQPPMTWWGASNDPKDVRIDWEQPLEKVASLIPKWIAKLKLQAEYDRVSPDDIRVVFGFDS